MTRGSRSAAAPALVAAALVLLVQMSASAAATPVITTPAASAAVGARPATVSGTSPGGVIEVRVYEGATLLAITGPNGGVWSVAINFADGAHTIDAVGRYGDNTLTPASPAVTFVVDTVAPSAPVITAPSNGELLAFSSFTVHGTAEPGTQLRLDVSNGSPIATAVDQNGNWSITRTWSDSTRTVTARAIDAAGNQSNPTSVTFTVDTTPPAPPSIDTPYAGLDTNATSIVVGGRAEPGAHVLLYESSQLADVVATNGSWSVTLPFAEATHGIYARARDAAGNLSASSLTTWFTVDTTAPPAPQISSPVDGSLVSAPGAIVSGTSEPGSTVQLLQNNIVSATGLADENGFWSIPYPRPVAGTFHVAARARDAAGNVGAASQLTTFTIDTQPPRVTITTPPGAIFTPLDPPLIQGTVHDDHGVSRVILDFYDVTGRGIASYNATCYGCPAADAQWTLTTTPLIGRFIVRAYAYDTVGNKSEFVSTDMIIVRTP
ncbi:MAG: Ig-like domain-containing protein [Actinomycetota bacterium]